MKTKTVKLYLDDGGESVSFGLNEATFDRLNAYLERNANKLQELKMLKLSMKYNNDLLGRVSIQQYTDAINTLFEIAVHSTGGSKAAAQVLLGLYNQDYYHADLVAITCNLDAKNRHAALVAILGRGQLMKEPHNVIEDGSRRFDKLWHQWSSLQIEKRYESYYSNHA